MSITDDKGVVAFYKMHPEKVGIADSWSFCTAKSWHMASGAGIQRLGQLVSGFITEVSIENDGSTMCVGIVRDKLKVYAVDIGAQKLLDLEVNEVLLEMSYQDALRDVIAGFEELGYIQKCHFDVYAGVDTH